MSKVIVTKNESRIDVKVKSPRNRVDIPGVISEYGAVSYVNEQNLTEEQQALAQSNIGMSPEKVAKAIAGSGLVEEDGQLSINASNGLEVTDYDTVQLRHDLILDCGTSTAVTY